MTTPSLTPAEQIARFIERHPGEWVPYAHPHAFALPPEERIGGYVLIVNHVRASLFVDSDGVLQVTTSLSWRGEYAPRLGISGREVPPLVSRIAIRVADSMQIFGGDVDALPPWLADPVRWILRTRAGELLTLAGSSPADVVSAAETLDEALCKRPVVEPTLSAMLAALQAIGMSCRWIRNPGDTGINPEREALEDARLALSCADDEMTREQYVDLFRDLRRVLGVTLTPLDKYKRSAAARCFNEDRDAMICARDEAQADGDHERVAWLQARLDGDWRDPAPQHRRALETP